MLAFPFIGNAIITFQLFKRCLEELLIFEEVFQKWYRFSYQFFFPKMNIVLLSNFLLEPNLNSNAYVNLASILVGLGESACVLY